MHQCHVHPHRKTSDPCAHEWANAECKMDYVSQSDLDSYAHACDFLPSAMTVTKRVLSEVFSKSLQIQEAT